MRRSLTLVLLFLASPASAADYSARVVGISDGDTITVLVAGDRQVKIRLHGIDAPETGQPFGSRAKQAASALAFGKTITILEALVVENPDELLYRENLASIHYNLGNLLCRNRRPGGPAELERARDIDEELVRQRPAVQSYRADLARTLGSIAVLHRLGHRLDEARVGFGRARDLLAELARDNPTVPRHRRDLITTYDNLRFLWVEAKSPENAAACLQQMRTLLEGLIQENPADEGLKRDLADITAELAKADRGPGRIRDVPNAFPDDVFAR
jgi:hypothetical protein